MIDVSKAQRILAEACQRLESVEADLAQALSCVLAETISADRDFPPTDRSAMDGFAVRSSDLGDDDGTLAVVGEQRAGEAAPARRLGPGEALRIFTGAIVPAGADAVVMVEDTEEDRDSAVVQVRGAVRARQHVRPQGSDLKRGQRVLEAGTPIRAAELAALASVGYARPRVYRKPTVCVLSTGDEVVEPTIEPEPHQIRNSNGHMLVAQLGQMGVEGDYIGVAKDTPDALGRLLTRGLAADVLLVTGGVSVGEYDLVGQALEQAGMRLLFHKIAMKPGKPILVGTVGRAGHAGRCLVFGLPGNPVSSFAGFEIFVAPALRRLMGHPDPGPREISVLLDGVLKTRPGRRTYHLARIDTSGERAVASPVRSTGSGDVLALARANGFVITEITSGGAEAGATLPALIWGG